MPNQEVYFVQRYNRRTGFWTDLYGTTDRVEALTRLYKADCDEPRDRHRIFTVNARV